MNQAGAMGKGGEVFLLDMGEPVRIMELARRMIELSGLTVKDESNPDGDIEIRIIGLRPGEKLYEELLVGDNPEPTPQPRIMKARGDFLPWAELEARLAGLEKTLDAGDAYALRQQLATLVSGYRPAANGSGMGREGGDHAAAGNIKRGIFSSSPRRKPASTQIFH